VKIIKWANSKGETLVLDSQEADELVESLKQAIRTGLYESEHFSIEIEN